ncbi:hypothetical protein NDU88_006817 [Pleurodeles waltl]|uniref:Uncharacterized protein n=1 Tax=Pleurodeles waltl TaxID=8319 RepID=A0AAV7MEC0_PLEWA|nr:hypothetical protein NDU88_006817 [Pleurodeles waltl]
MEDVRIHLTSNNSNPKYKLMSQEKRTAVHYIKAIIYAKRAFRKAQRAHQHKPSVITAEELWINFGRKIGVHLLDVDCLSVATSGFKESCQCKDPKGHSIVVGVETVALPFAVGERRRAPCGKAAAEIGRDALKQTASWCGTLCKIPGESTDDFVATLRTLATSYNYREFRDEVIRDQLIERTNNINVQEQLLATEDPDLETALKLARSIEHSQHCMKEMKDGIKFFEIKQIKAKQCAKPTKKGNEANDIANLRFHHPGIKVKRPRCYASIAEGGVANMAAGADV